MKLTARQIKDIVISHIKTCVPDIAITEDSRSFNTSSWYINYKVADVQPYSTGADDFVVDIDLSEIAQNVYTIGANSVMEMKAKLFDAFRGQNRRDLYKLIDGVKSILVTPTFAQEFGNAVDSVREMTALNIQITCYDNFIGG